MSMGKGGGKKISNILKLFFKRYNDCPENNPEVTRKHRIG